MSKITAETAATMTDVELSNVSLVLFRDVRTLTGTARNTARQQLAYVEREIQARGLA